MNKTVGYGKNLLYKYPNLLFEFLIFGFVGLIIETSYVYFMTGHWTVRGSLGYGLPIIHIYAIGSVVVVYLLGRFRRYPLFFFMVSASFMTLIELIGSYMEDWFGNGRTWNYGDKPFNFEGRICLSISLGWGALAFLFFFLMYPEIRRFIKGIPRKVLVYGSVFMTFYVILITYLKYFR